MYAGGLQLYIAPVRSRVALVYPLRKCCLYYQFLTDILKYNSYHSSSRIASSGISISHLKFDGFGG